MNLEMLSTASAPHLPNLGFLKLKLQQKPAHMGHKHKLNF